MPLVIAIVIGLVIGAYFRGAFEALAGAVLAWLAMRSLRQGRVIADLEQAVRVLSQPQATERVAMPEPTAARPSRVGRASRSRRRCPPAIPTRAS